jgi:glycosyltransferase involved in cell wall biosynthesis
VDGPGNDQPGLDRDVDVSQSPHFSPVRQRPASGLLSIVIPLFNEEENILALWERLRAVLEPSGSPFELIFVDDGSEDETRRMIDGLHARDERVVVVHLSRNFGHQPAISAGLEQARGHAVVVMDGDLQDPPELIPDLLRRWRGGYDVVYAVRRSRQEGFIKRLGYRAFYQLLGRISDLAIPLDSGDFCLMDRRVVDQLNRLPERCRFVRGLRSFLGFRQVGVGYDRPAREGGRPKYTLRKLAELAIDGLVSFSSTPLRLVTYMGLTAAGLALVLTVWVLNDAIHHHTAPKGWASTMIAVLFMGAVQLLSLGVIGEYIRLIFLESKQRPTYIVDEVKRHPRSACWEAESRDEVGPVDVGKRHHDATENPGNTRSRF